MDALRHNMGIYTTNRESSTPPHATPVPPQTTTTAPPQANPAPPQASICNIPLITGVKARTFLAGDGAVTWWWSFLGEATQPATTSDGPGRGGAERGGAGRDEAGWRRKQRRVGRCFLREYKHAVTPIVW